MRCHRRSACSTRISANARPPLSQLRARPLSQLVSVPPRRRYLGNCMYPNVATLVGDALAGKVTGMLLELPTPTIVALVASYDELKRAVGDAVAVLLSSFGARNHTTLFPVIASTPPFRL